MPYNPGITYRGDQWLAEGIASLGRSAAQGVDRYRNDAREVKALRTLAETYDPDGKDKYTAMGLGELRGAAQAFALQQSLQAQQTRDREANARIANLAADNLRGEEYLGIQRDQAARTKKRDELQEAFARVLAQPVAPNRLLDNPDVNAVFPGIAQQYRGPLGQIQQAMRSVPGGITPDVMQTFVRVAAEMADPARQATAEARRIEADAAKTRAEQPKGVMTEAQKAAAERGDRALDLKERQGREASLRAELKGITEALVFNPPNKAELEARAAALREQLDALRAGSETPQAPAAGSGAPNFSMDSFKAWKADRK